MAGHLRLSQPTLSGVAEVGQGRPPASTEPSDHHRPLGQADLAGVLLAVVAATPASRFGSWNATVAAAQVLADQHPQQDPAVDTARPAAGDARGWPQAAS